MFFHCFFKCKFLQKKMQCSRKWSSFGSGLDTSYKAAWFICFLGLFFFIFYSTVPSSLLISAALTKPLLSHYTHRQKKKVRVKCVSKRSRRRELGVGWGGVKRRESPHQSLSKLEELVNVALRWPPRAGVGWVGGQIQLDGLSVHLK